MWVSTTGKMSTDAPMVLDPWVGGTTGGRIKASDIADFERGWLNVSADISGMMLAELFPHHLHFRHQGWENRSICEEVETDEASMIMGYDGDDQCVYWTKAPVTSIEHWEILNDGTCGASEDPARAIYSSYADCTAAVVTKRFVCVSPETPGRQFCSPSNDSTGLGAASTWGTVQYQSMLDCESDCSGAPLHVYDRLFPTNAPTISTSTGTPSTKLPPTATANTTTADRYAVSSTALIVATSIVAALLSTAGIAAAYTIVRNYRRKAVAKQAVIGVEKDGDLALNLLSAHNNGPSTFGEVQTMRGFTYTFTSSTA